MINGDQGKRAKGPEKEGVRETGQRPFLDHQGLAHHLPEEIPNATAEGGQGKAGVRFRAANRPENGQETPAETAGVIRRDAEFSPDVFAQVLDINLTGTMRVCTAARPLLARRGGSIVNIASMLSYFGGARVPAYSASKGGVAQLTKSLALAWAADGIRVNAVAPGWIATPLTESLQQDAARSGQLLSRTALGRWGRPEEIAGPVLFLCSEAAAFVTGSILPVDGGYLAG